jgi:hypothetical protein
VSIDFILDKLERKIVQDYCGDCNKNEKKSIKGINPKSSDTDILEFEF